MLKFTADDIQCVRVQNFISIINLCNEIWDDTDYRFCVFVSFLLIVNDFVSFPMNKFVYLHFISLLLPHTLDAFHESSLVCIIDWDTPPKLPYQFTVGF